MKHFQRWKSSFVTFLQPDYAPVKIVEEFYPYVTYLQPDYAPVKIFEEFYPYLGMTTIFVT